MPHAWFLKKANHAVSSLISTTAEASAVIASLNEMNAPLPAFFHCPLTALHLPIFLNKNLSNPEF